jgi:autotransporter-associated beta strand protein
MRTNREKQFPSNSKLLAATMKPKFVLHTHVLTVSIAALLSMQSASATNYYWSADGATQGGVGTWNTSSANWGASATGPFSTIWNNGTPNFAIFPGVAGTVTLGEDITVSGFRFDTAGYTINPSTHTLTFGAANNSILLSGSANATITGTVGGGGNVALGPLPALGRTLTLNGTSTGGWSGSTTVNPGFTLALAESNQALLGTGTIAINGGGITLTNANTTEAALNRVSDSAPVTAYGGTVTFTNTSGADVYAETLGSVNLSIGQTNFVLATNQAGGGSQTLTLSGLTRTGATNTSAVTFSATTTSPNATTNRIVVTAATPTPVGQIIGPWATTGTGAGTQTDYAIFDSSSQVVPAAIAATTEDAWTTSTDPYTSSGAAVVLTGNRAINVLRNTGATATITLSNGVSGYTLATNGILNAVNSKLAIAPGTVPGALTAPGTSGGQIHINTGGSLSFPLTLNSNTITNFLAIDISAPINDNGGPVTLVKSGDTSVLNLSSATSNYSGGTVINAGILLVNGDAALGASSGRITLNGGQLRSFANNVTFNRVVEVGPAGGSFACIGNQGNINFSGKLTGSGVLNMVDTSGAAGRVAFFNSTENDFTGAFFIPSNATTVRVSSLPDSSGAGDIIYYKGGRGDPAEFAYGAGAIAPLVLGNRSIQIINNTGTTFSSATLTNNNTTQAITVNSDLIAIGSTAKTLTLNAVAGPANVFAGKISDGTGGGAVALTKAGVGSWALTGTNNSFTGAITLNSTTTSAGTLAYASAAGTNPITFAQTTSSATLAYTGAAPLTMSGLITASALTTGTITLDASGVTPAATINYSNPSSLTLVSTNTGARKIVLSGSNIGNNIFNGAITNNSGAGGTATLTKNGAGTWVLTGSNTYTGATTVNAGTLTLDYSSNNTGKLSDTAVLTLAGGTLQLAGGTHTEGVASTTLAAGTGSTVTRSSGTAVLAMNTITPGTGAVVNFAADNIATTDNLNANGILGTWATVGGANWAANSTDADDGLIVAYTGYTDVAAQGPGSTIADGATTNLRILNDGTSGSIELGASATTINSLLQSNASVAATVNTVGNTLAVGAVWISSGKAALTLGAAAGDGILTAATADSNLALINDSTRNLTINAIIADNTSASPLSKSGTGTVILNGNNIYTGATTISGGTLQIGSGGTTGSIATTSGVTNSAALMYKRSDALSVGYVISGTGSVTQQGTGTLTLTNANTYTGATTISAGTLQVGDGGTTGSIANTSGITNNAALIYNRSDDVSVGNQITGSGSLTKLGDGKLTLTAVPRYSGNTTVSAGTLRLNNPNPNNEAATVTLAASGALLELPFGGTDTVGSFIIGTTQQAVGVYGHTDSGATNGGLGVGAMDAYFAAGTGTLTVTPVAGFYAWQTANATSQTIGADHDHDGVSNGVEYFLGGPNGNTTGFTALPGVAKTGNTMSITWTHAADYTGIYGTDFVVETSTTLLPNSWEAETLGGTVSLDGNNVIFTFPPPLGTKKFARLKVNGP